MSLYPSKITILTGRKNKLAEEDFSGFEVASSFLIGRLKCGYSQETIIMLV